MLPQKHRLPLRLRRDQTEKNAQSFSSSLFTLLIAQPEDRKNQPSRFATLISKKISPQAVTRNRLRRRILNALRQLLPHLSSGFDILILPKKSILNADYKKIKQQLINTLKKAHVYSS